MVAGDFLLLFEGCNNETLKKFRHVFAEVKVCKSKQMLNEFVCCFYEKASYAKVSSRRRGFGMTDDVETLRVVTYAINFTI